METARDTEHEGTSIEDLLARLHAASENAARIHVENLKLFVREAQTLLKKGDVRDAAEKAWAAYKSLLGLLLSTVVLPRIEEEVKKIWSLRGPREAKDYVEWWSKTGLLVPSARQKLDKIVDLVVEVTRDKEIKTMKAIAAILHVFFYHGPDIAEISEKEAAETIEMLIDWILRKVKHYKLF